MQVWLQTIIPAPISPILKSIYSLADVLFTELDVAAAKNELDGMWPTISDRRPEKMEVE